MTNATYRLTQALVETGRTVRRTGELSYLAQCSGHQDGRPSLSIRQGRGQALVFCFAGCQIEEIAQGAGLRVSDLFDNPQGVEYTYRNNDAVVRRVFRTPTKDFHQKVYEVGTVSLYSPPEQDLGSAVEAGREVWVPEGEKDCDTLFSEGFIATTSPMGATNWHKADWSPLRDAKSVVIVADRDEAGLVRARDLFAHLEKLGVRSLRIVQSRVGKDATDHVVAGYGVHDFSDVVADPEFEQSVEDARRRSRVTREARRRDQDEQWARSQEKLNPMSLADVLALPTEEPDWILGDLMARGERLVLVGGEGRGKSMMLRQLIICGAAGINPLSFGPSNPTGELLAPARGLVIDAENSLPQWARGARYLADLAGRQGHNPHQNLVVQAGVRMNLTDRNTVDQIHRWIDEYKPELMALGPIYKMVPGSLNDEDDMAALLATLDGFRERGITLLIEGHAGHGTDTRGEREYRPRGSSMMLGWPEFGLGIKPLEEDPAMVDLVKWRGDRENRPWPSRLRRGVPGELPWMPAA